MSDEMTVTDGGALSALTIAEIDQQVATARKWPRNTDKFRRQVALMSSDPVIAEECTYVLPRKDKTGATKNIEGPSVRFAEIVASEWGNCRVAGRVLAVEQDHIVAQGAFHDLERNVAVCVEVRKRITGRDGRRFSEDMVTMTGNNAAATALRNAVFKGVPKAYWVSAWEASRKVLLGDSKTMDSQRLSALSHFQKFGVTTEQVLASFNITKVEQLTAEHLATLKGIAVALRDGETTAEQAFAGHLYDADEALPDAVPAPEAKPMQKPAVVKVETVAAVTESTTLAPAQEPSEPEPTPAPKQPRKAKAAPVKEEPAVEEPTPAVVSKVTNAGFKIMPGFASTGKKPEAAPASDFRKLPTAIVLPHEFATMPDNPILPLGCVGLRSEEAGFVVWNGKEWAESPDQDELQKLAIVQMRQVIHMFFRDQKMTREEAMQWVGDKLQIQDPGTTAELPFEKLLRLTEIVASQSS